MGRNMRLIDAEKAYEVLTDYYHHRTEIQHEALKEAIGRVPTVDAVEVVRCKDCIHYWNRNGVCDAHIDLIDVDDDCYCSWGERKDEVTDAKG